MRSAITSVFAITLAVVAATGSAAAATLIGKVAATVGTPSASGPGGDRNLKAGSAVFEDDKIVVRTGNAQIVLADGTRLVVGPGSTLVLEKFLMRGGNKAQKVSIKALRGTFRFITGRSPKSAYEIQTANATIGIRGTAFDLWSQSATGAAVLDGSINLCNKDHKDQCVVVHEGCEVGRVSRSESRKLTAQVRGVALAKNLPYIVNQSSLRQEFRLPIGDCKTFLPITDSGSKDVPKLEPRLRDQTPG